MDFRVFVPCHRFDDADVKFHDGTPLEAEDVKYSFEQYADPEHRRSVYPRGIQRVEVKDAGTVDIRRSRASEAPASVPATTRTPDSRRRAAFCWRTATAGRPGPGG